MKKAITLALCIVALVSGARADILANGDFSNGTGHWHGDGRAASDSPDLAMQNETGLVIELKPTKWTQVSQTFNSRDDGLSYSVVFKTSPDYKFADNAFPDRSIGSLKSVLENILSIRLDGNIKYKRGGWLLVLFDPEQQLVSTSEIRPNPAIVGEPQSVKGSFTKVAAHAEKALYLIFPPGEGKITLINVALSLPDAAATPNP